MSRFLEPEHGQFRDEKEFIRLLKKGELNVGQLIRAYNYGVFSGDEKVYVLGLEGKLYDGRTQEEVEPKKVLRNKDGWGFDRYGIWLLPDEVVKKHFEMKDGKI